MAVRKIVVIGGVAAGLKAAVRARRCDPKAEISVIEKGNFISYSACGLPYFISDTVKKFDDLRSTPIGVLRNEGFFKVVKGVSVLTHTLAESIDRKAKEVAIRNLKTDERRRLPYDKLVLATGAEPIMPKLPGIDLAGVFKLHTALDALAIKGHLENVEVKRAVVLGASPVGLEAVEALSNRGVKVTIVETLGTPLADLLDPEMGAVLKHCLEDEDIEILLGDSVERFEGQQRIERVITSKGLLEADMAIIAVGVRPQVMLAKEAGLALGETGAIAVNEYLQTSDPDIYAGGDCAETFHLVSRSNVYMPKGSVANRQGRVIGDNVCDGQKTFPGVLGTHVLKVFTLNIGVTGLNEQQAKAAGFDVEIGLSPAPDREHYWPEAKTIIVKLIAEKPSGRVLGCQVVGSGDATKRVDVAATAITFGADVRQLSNLDLGYAPPYSWPIDNLVTAGNVIENKLDGLAKGISPFKVKEKLDRGEDFFFLDARMPQEFAAIKIAPDRVHLIPLGKLREQLNEVPRDKEIITFCAIGLRGYEAQLILEEAGVNDVKFMDGGVTTWPFELE